MQDKYIDKFLRIIEEDINENEEKMGGEPVIIDPKDLEKMTKIVWQDAIKFDKYLDIVFLLLYPIKDQKGYLYCIKKEGKKEEIFSSVNHDELEEKAYSLISEHIESILVVYYYALKKKSLDNLWYDSKAKAFSKVQFRNIKEFKTSISKKEIAQGYKIIFGSNRINNYKGKICDIFKVISMRIISGNPAQVLAEKRGKEAEIRRKELEDERALIGSYKSYLSEIGREETDLIEILKPFPVATQFLGGLKGFKFKTEKLSQLKMYLTREPLEFSEENILVEKGLSDTSEFIYNTALFEILAFPLGLHLFKRLKKGKFPEQASIIQRKDRLVLQFKSGLKYINESYKEIENIYNKLCDKTKKVGESDYTTAFSILHRALNDSYPQLFSFEINKGDFEYSFYIPRIEGRKKLALLIDDPQCLIEYYEILRKFFHIWREIDELNFSYVEVCALVDAIRGTEEWDLLQKMAEEARTKGIVGEGLIDRIEFIETGQEGKISNSLFIDEETFRAALKKEIQELGIEFLIYPSSIKRIGNLQETINGIEVLKNRELSLEPDSALKEEKIEEIAQFIWNSLFLKKFDDLDEIELEVIQRKASEKEIENEDYLTFLRHKINNKGDFEEYASNLAIILLEDTGLKSLRFGNLIDLPIYDRGKIEEQIKNDEKLQRSISCAPFLGAEGNCGECLTCYLNFPGEFVEPMIREISKGKVSRLLRGQSERPQRAWPINSKKFLSECIINLVKNIPEGSNGFCKACSKSSKQCKENCTIHLKREIKDEPWLPRGEGQYLCIFIEDNGRGFTEENYNRSKHKEYEPFSIFHSQYTGSGKEGGEGLWSVYYFVVEKYKGGMEVVSNKYRWRATSEKPVQVEKMQNNIFKGASFRLIFHSMESK